MRKNLTRLSLLLILSSNFASSTQPEELANVNNKDKEITKTFGNKILSGLRENKLVAGVIGTITLVLAGAGLLKLRKKTKLSPLSETQQVRMFLEKDEGKIAKLLAYCFEKELAPVEYFSKNTNSMVTRYAWGYKNDLGIYIPTGEKEGLVLALKSFVIEKEKTTTSAHWASGNFYSLNRGDVFAVRINDKNELVSKGYYLQINPYELDKGYLQTVVQDSATLGKWSKSKAYQPAKVVANVLVTMGLSYIPIIGTSYVGMMAVGAPASQWAQNRIIPTPAVPYRLF